MWGSVENASLNSLMIAFAPCTNSTGVVCKSPEEIKNWMYRKTLVMVINHNEFIKHKFGEEAMQKQSRMLYKNLTPISPTEYIVEIERSYIKLDDSLLGLNFIFRKEEQGFSYNIGDGREINWSATAQTIVSFEVSRTQKNYFRQVDTIFDLLATLGGFFSAFALICHSLVSALQFYGSY